MNQANTKKPTKTRKPQAPRLQLSPNAIAVQLIFDCAKEDIADPANDVFAQGASALEALKRWESAATTQRVPAAHGRDRLDGLAPGRGRVQTYGVVRMRSWVNAEVARREKASDHAGKQNGVGA